MNKTTLSSKWNPKRSEVTYRLGKQGVGSFLLFGVQDLKELRSIIDTAIEGHNDRDQT